MADGFKNEFEGDSFFGREGKAILRQDPYILEIKNRIPQKTNLQQEKQFR